MSFPKALTVCLFLASTSLVFAQQDRFLGRSAFQWGQELNSRDDRMRRNAAFALGKLGSSSAADLGKLLELAKNDAKAGVRETATYSIGEICRDSLLAQQNNEVIPTLQKALKDSDPMVRRSAAYAIGCLGSRGSAALADLQGAIRDQSPEVRQNVAWALGNMGKEGVPGLRQALQDRDPLVLRDAAGALGRMGKEGRPAISDLVACLRNPDKEVRRSAITAVVQLVSREDAAFALAPLRAALGDADVEIRRNAALALGNIGGSEASGAVPVLIDALENGPIELRRQAAAILRNIGPSAQRAVPALRKALAHSDTQLRRNAAVALGGMESAASDAVPDLVHLLSSNKEDDEVRKEAAVALSRIGRCRAAIEGIPSLIGVVGDRESNAEVRAITLWALRVHEEDLDKYQNLFETLNRVITEPKTGTNKMLRYDAAFLLGVYKRKNVNDRVLDTLLEFLEDDKIIIYTGTKSTSTGSGSETGGGSANISKEGRGDGRVMAVHALEWIGRSRIRQRQDIMTQLRRIIDNPATVRDLREKAKKVYDAYSS